MSPEHETDMISGPLTRISSTDDSNRRQVEAADTKRTEEPESLVLFINEENLAKSPMVEISLTSDMRVKAILDSGSEVNLLAQSIYDKLLDSGMDVPTLPLENVVLVTAFGKRSSRVKRQAMIEFSIGNDLFEVNFFISQKLVNDAILGCHFMKENGVSLNFEKENFSYVKEGLVKEQLFYQPAATLEVGRSDRRPRDTGTPNPPMQVSIQLCPQLTAISPSHS
jgi:hypothetical protein